MLNAIVALSGMVLALLLLRIARTLERRPAIGREPDPGYTTLYPVYTENELRGEFVTGIRLAKRSKELERRLLDDEQFRQESSQGQFSNEIAERMLGVRLVCGSRTGLSCAKESAGKNR